MTARDELVRNIREADTKSRTLHEARMKAHAEMLAAIEQHRFLVRASELAHEEGTSARYALEDAIRREALEAVA